MLGWLTPLHLVCVIFSLPNEIKQLLLNIFFFGTMPWLIIDQFAHINQKKTERNNSEKHETCELLTEK